MIHLKYHHLSARILSAKDKPTEFALDMWALCNDKLQGKYNMSVPLTKACSELETKDLKTIEKFILTLLCFKANDKHEAYMCIDKLILATSSSHNTVDRALKVLRDKKYLSYTNRFAPKSRSIPVYNIHLTHPQNGGG